MGLGTPLATAGTFNQNTGVASFYQPHNMCRIIEQSKPMIFTTHVILGLREFLKGLRDFKIIFCSLQWLITSCERWFLSRASSGEGGNFFLSSSWVTELGSEMCMILVASRGDATAE